MRQGLLAILALCTALPLPAVASPFVINEVVTDPQQDWSDTGGGGTGPFKGVAGGGTVSDVDEYVELLNVSGQAQSLEGWMLTMDDTTSPAYDCFGLDVTAPCTTAAVYRVFDDTGTEITTGTIADRLKAVPAGGYVVIGNPSGAMNNTITLTLEDEVDTTVDEIVIANGDATSAVDEAVSRFSNGADSDDDATDLKPLLASLGTSNGSLCAVSAGATVINEVVVDPQQDWDRDGADTPFDGAAGAGTVGVGDEYVELKNTSGGALDLRGCVLTMDDGSVAEFVFQDADAPAAPYVRVFSSAGALVGTAVDLDAVPAGGYVVLGNPPGTLNNDIAITVSGAATIDTITVSGGAAGPPDESVSRFSDGTDSDDDAADLKHLLASPGASNGALCGLAAGDAVINEVVVDPQQDWDRGGLDTPFDGAPGAGSVGVGDEYLEIKNTSGGDLNLSGCLVTMTDTTTDVFVFQPSDFPAAPYVRVFSSAGALVGTAADITAIPSGGYVLLGDAPGSLNNDSTLTLSGTAAIDTVTVSGNAAALLDESVSRFSDGADSDNDAADLKQLLASPGASNGDLCALAAGDVVINEVVSDPQQDWNKGGIGTPFDGSPGTGALSNDDEYIELKNTSNGVLDLRGCVLTMDDGSIAEHVFQAHDAAAAPYVRVFDNTGTQVGTATDLNAIPVDGYVLLGNPAGTMNLSIAIDLSGTALIDEESFSDDAPDLNSTSVNNESGARVPDGADSDSGVADFFLQPATPGANNELDECTLGIDNCDANATCANIAARFTCTCNAGYQGDGTSCSEIDECADNTHDCDANATCTNEVPGWSCACNDGFSGDGTACADIDECATGSNDCSADAICANNAGSYTCTCPDGFTGNGTTCTDVNECSLANTCDENADCRNNRGGFTCTCSNGYSGDGTTCTKDSAGGCQVDGQGSGGGLGLGLLALVLVLGRRRRDSLQS